MESTRKDALQAVERFYCTGKPCKYGHLAKRFTIDGACTQCRYEAGQEIRRDFAKQLREKESLA